MSDKPSSLSNPPPLENYIYLCQYLLTNVEYADILITMNTEQLRKRLRTAGIHQNEIATRLGIHRTLYNKMLKGHRVMSESIYNASDVLAHKLISERIKVLVNIDDL
jgi:hypothetical protein